MSLTFFLGEFLFGALNGEENERVRFLLCLVCGSGEDLKEGDELLEEDGEPKIEAPVPVPTWVDDEEVL